MHKRLVLFFLVSLAQFVSAEIVINEVMYNPEGEDNNREYIEVYSTVSLENFTIEDLASSDVLKLVKSTSNFYSLIVEDGFNYSNIDASIYAIGATIGNDLNNDGDVFVLRDQNGKLLDAFSYIDGLGGDGDGFSLCRFPDVTGLFSACSPSPGLKNDQDSLIDNDIRINEFLPDPTGNDSASMPWGEWIELYNFGDSDVDVEGFFLKDEAGHQIIISDTRVLETTMLEEEGYLVVYMNGFFGFLNNDDLEHIYLFDSAGNLIDDVSYDGSQEGVSWGLDDSKWILSEPTPHTENPIGEHEITSSISIERVYIGTDHKAKWGDTLRVRLQVSRGNTTKEAVEAYIVDEDENLVSKRTMFDIHDHFVEHDFTIPIQIYPNCKQKYENGIYELVIEGLDDRVTTEFEIREIDSALCAQQSLLENSLVYEILDAPKSISPEEEFDVLLKVTNYLDVQKGFEVWSEVSDGSKIVSEKKKEDGITSILPSGGSTVLHIGNSIPSGENGDYELAVKFLEDGKKRAKSVRQPIVVVSNKESNSETVLNEEVEEPLEKVAYLSSGNKQKNIALYLLIFLIILLAVYGVTRNDKSKDH